MESYMLSMLKNFRLMKIWRLENIVFYNIEKMTLEAKDQEKKQQKLSFVISIATRLLAIMIMSGFVLLYLYNDGEISATNLLVLL
jgi:hypothetical protein